MINSGVSAQTGYVRFEVNVPGTFYVVPDNDFHQSRLITSGDSVSVPTGEHTITMISHYFDDIFRDVFVEEGKTTLVKEQISTFRIDHNSSWKYLMNETNVIIQTDDESVIYIDDQEVGLSQASLLLNPGTYKLRIEHPDEGSLKDKIEIGYAEGLSYARYNVNPIKFNPAMKILPGAGYLINGQNQRAIGTYLVLAGLGFSWYSTTQKYNDAKSEYDFYGDYITVSKQHLTNLKRNRDLSRLGFFGFYLLTTIDSFRKPKNGYPGKKVDFDLSANSVSSITYPEVTFTYRFTN